MKFPYFAVDIRVISRLVFHCKFLNTLHSVKRIFKAVNVSGLYVHVDVSSKYNFMYKLEHHSKMSIEKHVQKGKTVIF